MRERAEEPGEKWRAIWQQSSAGVGESEYLRGRYSNGISINVPGHLLNRATAVRLDDVQLSPRYDRHLKQKCDLGTWCVGRLLFHW